MARELSRGSTREAVVFVRINDIDAQATIAQATIVVPVGGESAAEMVGAALIKAGLADTNEWSYGA